MGQHPVIDDINKKLDGMKALPEEQYYEAFNKLRIMVSHETGALFTSLTAQEQEDPGRLDPRQIQRYRELEIATTYLSAVDYSNPTTRHNIENIINGLTPTNQPTLGKQFQHALDRARPEAQKTHGFTISVSHPRP